MKALLIKYRKSLAIGFVIPIACSLFLVGMWWLFGPVALWSQTEIGKLEIQKQHDLQEACEKANGEYVLRHRNLSNSETYECEWKAQ